MAALKYRKIAEMPVRGDEDIISVRQTVRFELQKQGVGLLEQTRLVAAVSELTRCSHTQFDPQVVRAFIKAVEKNDLSIDGL